jgi:chemotaxis protein MotB
MANSIGIFEAGGSAVGTGNLIASGMSQLTELGEYYTNMGKASKKTGSDMEAEDNDSSQEDTNQNNQEDQSEAGNGTAELSEALERIEKEMVEASSEMYDKVSDLTEQYALGDYVELSIDPDYKFVQLSFKGSILFDSGAADIKEQAKPILSNVGEILLKFDGFKVEIIGHTDNVPMSGTAFKDNNWLSSGRALNAAEFLIDNSNLDPSNIRYSGRGEYDPIASNSTADGRAKNRRIEIKIYNEYSGE